jgi:hypothetical protein
VLLLDLFLPPEQKRVLPAVTVAGLVVFTLAALQAVGPGWRATTEFWGSYRLDTFALFFKVLFALSAS